VSAIKSGGRLWQVLTLYARDDLLPDVVRAPFLRINGQQR
jgi:hypothetical protein